MIVAISAPRVRVSSRNTLDRPRQTTIARLARLFR